MVAKRGTVMKRLKRTHSGYVLIEVLLAMTIMAIAGTALLQSLRNSVDASRSVRDMTKAIYLTQAKLNELKTYYYRREGAQLGELRGNFDSPGAEKFQWTAQVERDRERDAYVITVWTSWGQESNTRRQPRGRYRYLNESGYMLRTLVPVPRYNEQLIFGGAPQFRRTDDPRSERANQRAQERGRGTQR